MEKGKTAMSGLVKIGPSAVSYALTFLSQVVLRAILIFWIVKATIH